MSKDFGSIPEIHYPKKGCKLFQETNDYYGFAHYGWRTKSDFYGYIKGYKEAGDLVVEVAVTSNDIAKLDAYIFPIVFNYRQFLELSLKSLYLEYSEEDKDSKTTSINHASHNLIRMWNKLEHIFISINTSEVHKQMIEDVKSYVFQFQEFDNNSFTFRYPLTKNLDPTLKEENRLDLRNLRARISELSNFFDGIDGSLDHIKRAKEDAQEYQREVEADIRAEYEAEMRQMWAEEMRTNIEWE